MQRPRRKSNAKKAAKAQVDAIMRNAETLLGEPDLLVPESRTWNVFFPWRGVRRRLHKISSEAGDAKRLEPYAKRGHPLAKAFAVSLMVLAEGKAPYLGSMRTPMGDYQFAVRGSVKPEYLVGVQHFDDPVIRLLAYRREVSWWGGHLYSMHKGLYYSRKHDAGDYLSAWREELPKEETCDLPGPFVALHWRSVGKDYHFCRKHAEDEGSTFSRLTGMMLSKRISDDFDFRGGWRLRRGGETEEVRTPIDGNLRKAYALGLMTDAVLLDKVKGRAKAGLENGPGPLFIIGDQTYRGDASAFLSALSPSEDERKVLERMLRGNVRPVILEEPRANSCMLALADRFPDGLRALTADESLVRGAAVSTGKEQPTETVRKVAWFERERRTDADLPRFHGMGPAGMFADRVARMAKAGDVEGALRTAEKEIPPVAKGKAISCAMISALGGLKPRAWLFNQLEMESGEYLRPKAEALLKAKGDDYRRVLNELLLHSGSGEEAR